MRSKVAELDRERLESARGDLATVLSSVEDSMVVQVLYCSKDGCTRSKGTKRRKMMVCGHDVVFASLCAANEREQAGDFEKVPMLQN